MHFTRIYNHLICTWSFSFRSISVVLTNQEAGRARSLIPLPWMRKPIGKSNSLLNKDRQESHRETFCFKFVKLLFFPQGENLFFNRKTNMMEIRNKLVFEKKNYSWLIDYKHFSCTEKLKFQKCWWDEILSWKFWKISCEVYLFKNKYFNKDGPICMGRHTSICLIIISRICFSCHPTSVSNIWICWLWPFRNWDDGLSI